MARQVVRHGFSVVVSTHQGGRPHRALQVLPLSECEAGDVEEFVHVDLDVLDGEREHLERKLVNI